MTLQDRGDGNAARDTRLGGHLFVVNGKLEAVIHDAAIIPVGEEFHFNHYWKPLVGSSPIKPERWAQGGWGRVFGGPDRVWAVSVGGHFADPYDQILDRVERAVARVSERRDRYPTVRDGALPLVAVPVIGIGLGGYGDDRGTVLRELVDRLHSAADRHDVDIVLVTPDASVYAAAQYARKSLPGVLPDELEETARDLGKRAMDGELALFLGAGVSCAAGLPGWRKLISTLADRFGVRGVDGPDSGLSFTDQAELIQMAAKDEFRKQVIEIASSKPVPSLLHGLLAGLDCREVVTTNYDLLYEHAVAASGRSIESVMPWASALGADRWVLKLHGDIGHPKGIVLTRRSMVTYDAANRPSGAVLQSLLTKRLLVVGTSMTDDNVIRLAHEVEAYRAEHQRGASGTFGTVLDADGDRLRSRLWEGQLDWLLLPEAGLGDGRRATELFLDRVAFHAARGSSWLLDKRFEGLLNRDEHDHRIAQEIRDLYLRIPQREGTKWSPLVRRLEELGVRSGD